MVSHIFKAQVGGGAFCAAMAVFALWPELAFAQEPPLDYPKVGRLSPIADTITVGEWALYPTFSATSLYSDNWFLSPTAPISAWGVGISPSISAEWTNGIHKTTAYARFEHRDFPSQPAINTLDYSAGISQRYEMLRDLIFNAQFDYNHTTISPGLTNGVPTSAVAPASTLLPDGNTLLPNGNLVSPGGQIVGTSNPGLTVNGTSVVNPFDTFTGNASVTKYFNRAVVSFNVTGAKATYQTPSQSTPNSTSANFSGSGSFWLTPVLYAYSNGNWATNSNSVSDTRFFRAIGGLGFRPNQLFNANAYWGRQGSESSATTGGDVFGVSFSYNPRPDLSFAVHLDETINIAPSTGVQSPFVQSLPQTSLLIPIGASTKSTGVFLTGNYTPSPLWSVSGNLGYTRVDYFGSVRSDESWLVDTALIYNIRWDMSLNLDYQFSTVGSNVSASARRNLVTMGALYKF